MKTKKCNRCNLIKAESEFYKRHGIPSGPCKSCHAKQMREYNQRPEVKSVKKQYYTENHAKCRAYQKKWQLKNLAYWREYHKNNSDTLADTYVKRLIRARCKIPTKSITSDLIDIYRKYLTVKRSVDKHFDMGSI